MRPFLRYPHFLVASLALASFASAEAQDTTSGKLTLSPVTGGVVTVSGDSVDQLRLAYLLGKGSDDRMMLRSTSTLTDPGRGSGRRSRSFTLVFPQITYVNNTKLPFGQNDGALWAGVGANVRALAGFTATYGPVRLIAIPELAYSANNRLPINPVDPRFVPQPDLLAGRNHFSSPWNQFPYSIDLPWRMGDAPIRKVYPGQSSLTVTAGPIQIGAATENEWWGPALRNPIVMSDNAAGMPHGFIRTSGPLNTLIGRIDAHWMLGTLKESGFFDESPHNNTRSLSALAIAWKRNADANLTLGFTRAVFAEVPSGDNVASHFLDALKNVGHPDALGIEDRRMTPGSDQLMSLFGRWAFPVYGLETYIEWARADFPISIRDFLEQPEHSRGYTAGLQWVRTIGSDMRLRLQGEATNEEQSTTYRFRPVGSYYTSRSVIQGYTNFGQIIGSGIGPGSSAQWLDADFFKGGWLAGITVGRTRFNNDAYFMLPFALSYANQCAHDVTMYPGVRGGYSNSFFRIKVDYQHANRYNTFFQNRESCAKGGAGSDRVNKNLQVTLSTFGW
jgi:Capsule assembly protein Wzi